MTAQAIVAIVAMLSGSTGLIVFNRQQNHKAIMDIQDDWQHYGEAFSHATQPHIHAEIDAWGKRELQRQKDWRASPLYKQLRWPPAVNPDPFDAPTTD